MEILELLLQGFGVVFSFTNITAAIVGGILGIVIGGLPGLGAATGIALLLPLTFSMDPTTGIIMLAAIYYGCMYGGAFSAILVNIPGDSPAITTALDGYPLTKKGLAGKALFTAIISSFIGGTIGIVILTFMGPLLARIGLAFGPPEIATVILLALCSISWLFGASPTKGLISTLIGVLLAVVGLDLTSGEQRYTFGTSNLLGGITFIALIIGMFGFSQVMEMMIRKNQDNKFEGKLTIKESILNKSEIKRIVAPAGRTGILGSFVGILPGAGSTTGAMFSYILEKRIGKNRKEMGKGAIEGVAASESGNNASAIGAFAPLLSLGIPGSAATAILLGGLIMWGLNPGPMMFQNNPDFIWGLISSMYIGNVITLIAALAFIPFLVYFIRIPQSILTPIIIILCVLGAYTAQNSMFDVWLMLVLGVVGFLLIAHQYPIAPLLLAFVLTPMLEVAVGQSLSVSSGDFSIFFRGPITITMMSLIVIFIIGPLIYNVIKKYILKTHKE